MADDPDAWPDPWPEPVIYEEWKAEHLRMLRESKHFPSVIRPRDEVVWNARREEFKDNPNLRKWAIWKQYKAGGVTLRDVGDDFGIGRERVRQIVAKCDRLLRTALGRVILALPTIDEVRDGTLGVEFVFRNELTFTDYEDQKGWEQLEPDVTGSAYKALMPEWREEWGRQDTSEPKPRPAYTFYKVVIPKEQTDATETDDG